MIIELRPGFYFFGVRHGRRAESEALRQFLNSHAIDAICLDIPSEVGEGLRELIHKLPEIHALIFKDTQGEQYWVANDPCEVVVEAFRQSEMLRIPIVYSSEDALLYPNSSGFQLDATLLDHVDGGSWSLPFLEAALNDCDLPPYLGNYFNQLKPLIDSDKKVLCLGIPEALCFIKYWLVKGSEVEVPIMSDLGFHDFESLPHDPQSLYFSLGEWPATTAWIEKNRRDLFSPEESDELLFKKLLIRTRREYLKKGEALSKSSQFRLQKVLDFSKRLARQSGRLQPDLIDAVEACKGVLGDRFALQFLKAAKDYPYFNLDNKENWIKATPYGLHHPVEGFIEALPLFRDIRAQYEHINLRTEVPKESADKMRKEWNPFRSCSHIPEDISIEGFNKRARQIALKSEDPDQMTSRPFLSDLADGIDLRETLRHWGENRIYIKEKPRQKFRADTVLLLFDTEHDEEYPNQMVWYAEHDQESTLSFYATAELNKMIGPGIAELKYGGLSLLFPPRPTFNPFGERPATKGFNLAEKLLWGAAVQSSESHIIVCSVEKPSEKMQSIARLYGRTLVHLPFSHFGDETLQRLRRFHMLNGKEVRGWAKRFIGY